MMRLEIRILTIALLTLTSCNTYLDTIKKGQKEPIRAGYFTVFKDSNLFTYKTNIIATRDTEKVYPKFFEVVLPKKIKYYQFAGLSNFEFYYDNNQVVVIKIDLESKMRNKDTTYNPSKEKLEELIQSDFKTRGGKYDIKKIPLSQGRKNMVLIKGDATILLLNITDNNYSQFFKYLSSFKFIE